MTNTKGLGRQEAKELERQVTSQRAGSKPAPTVKAFGHFGIGHCLELDAWELGLWHIPPLGAVMEMMYPMQRLEEGIQPEQIGRGH